MPRDRRTVLALVIFLCFHQIQALVQAGMRAYRIVQHLSRRPFVHRIAMQSSTPPRFAAHFSSAINIPTHSSSSPGAANNNVSTVHSAYEEWVRTLYTTNAFHPVKMGLTNIEKLYEEMGKPIDNAMIVHIAGTNGKGSVALKIAKTLELSNPNLKVGLFCSPHVSSFRERMQVNGELITEDEVVKLLPKIYEICREKDIPATFFEITTALAFSFYAERQADVVVLETGLGGRLDATNVIQNPAVAVITSIGLEHTRILGDTIEQIAREKGGIIKKGRPILVGPNVPHEVLRACAEEKGASLYCTSDDILGKPELLSQEDMQDYDIENSRIAAAALKLLESSHPDVVGTLSEEVILKGTSQRPPCRFEEVETPDGVKVILDVAHNPPAMDYLVRKLQATFPNNKLRIVVGMSSDKDLRLCGESILQVVDGDASRIHLVEAAHPRAAKLEAILEASTLRDGANYDLTDRSVTRQIMSAMVPCKANDETLVVCGSVFLMAEAREALGFDEPRDSEYIAEVAGAGFRHAQENFGNNTTASVG